MNIGSKLPNFCKSSSCRGPVEREEGPKKKKKKNTNHPRVTFTKNKHIFRGTSTRPVILPLQVVFSKAPTPNTEEAHRKKTKETQKSTVDLKIQNLRSQPVASYKTSQIASCI
jgi:hypothetical protein